MVKYHVALSFAGEDRKYVKEVAESLKEKNIEVFYDEFEEVKLWGKDLYDYLIDIYQNKAYFTVIFISKAYKEKVWPNLERRAAQERALKESREYILPARFDDTKIPGLLDTIAYLDLRKLTPEEFAEKIIKKLEEEGIIFKGQNIFQYSPHALSDADFPLFGTHPIYKIIKKLKSYNWYEQNPAIRKLFKIEFSGVSRNAIFVLGRNIYQAACGKANEAEDFLSNLRSSLASFPEEVALHLLAGMFYEIYFDKNAKFRGLKLKAGFIEQIFNLQTVERYKPVFKFIRMELQPYKNYLIVIPGEPGDNNKLMAIIEEIEKDIILSRFLLKELRYKDKNIIIDKKEIDLQIDDELAERVYIKLDGEKVNEFKSKIAKYWGVPSQFIVFNKKKIDDWDEIFLETEKVLKYPAQIWTGD